MAQTTTKSNNAYDFIVVGAGTAGLVVARRLVEQSNASVLVIEAGERHLDARITVPGQWMSAYADPNLTFAHSTSEQHALERRQISVSTGKVWGGSSAINAGMFSPPCAATMDAWAELTENPAWAWSAVKDHFRAPFKLHVPDGEKQELLRMSEMNTENHGSDGPIDVSFAPQQNDVLLTQAYIDAYSTVSTDVNNIDPYGGYGNGPYAALQTVSSVNGVRSFAGNSYGEQSFCEAHAERLHVLTNTYVDRIVFKPQSSRSTPHQGQAVITHDPLSGEKSQHNCLREIILCAGAIGSPAILQRSGIGNRANLTRLGIETVVELDGVGENLQDHLMTSFSRQVRSSVPTLDGLVRGEPRALQLALEQYESTKKGPLATGCVRAQVIVPSLNVSETTNKSMDTRAEEQSRIVNKLDVNAQAIDIQFIG